MNKVNKLWFLILIISNLAAQRNYLFNAPYLSQIEFFHASMCAPSSTVLLVRWICHAQPIHIFHYFIKDSAAMISKGLMLLDKTFLVLSASQKSDTSLCYSIPEVSYKLPSTLGQFWQWKGLMTNDSRTSDNMQSDHIKSDDHAAYTPFII